MDGDWDFPDRRFYYCRSFNYQILTHQQFRTQLLEWALAHPRPLPWKGIDNPYFIWLSEILLQQTRVEQGLPYYLKFKDKMDSMLKFMWSEDLSDHFKTFIERTKIQNEYRKQTELFDRLYPKISTYIQKETS